MMDSFRGWYLKCQSDFQTLAVIPASLQSGKARSSSVQLITEGGAWQFGFPYEAYQEAKKGFGVRVGGNTFDASGIRLHLKNSSCAAFGDQLNG